MALVPVSAKSLEALRNLDTCTISNAIETFEVRLRNAGFANSRIRCMFPDLSPMVGYATTARLRSAEPPIGGSSYHDRTEWWHSILQVPTPRIVVLQDMDDPSGVGAFLGDVHAAILKALGCVGYVTNGAVRELPKVKSMGVQAFAGSVAVSHAYAHLFDVGAKVEIGALEIKTGDLLHGDLHGLLKIPAELAERIPTVAARLNQEEKRIIDFCSSAEFSLEKLRQTLKG